MHHEAAGRAEHDDREHGSHEVHSLRALFRERRLSLRTMERPLRLATGAAAASLLGTVLLIALRDAGGADVSLGRTSSGVVTAISTPVFVATLVLVSIGFAYVLAGAVLASIPIALLALAIMTLEIGLYTGAFGNLFGFGGFFTLLPSWATWTARGLIVLIWVLAAVVIVVDRRHRGEPTRRFRLSLLAAYALLFGGYFTILYFASPTIGHLNLFPESVGLLMLDIADLVTPILFIAAVDFGEWGGLLGERVAALLKVRVERLLVPLAAVLAVSLIWYGYAQIEEPAWFTWHRVWIALRTTLLLTIALIAIIAIGRALGLHKRRWPSTLNFAGLFVVVAASVYVIAPLTGVIVGKFHGVTHLAEQVTPEGEYTAAADVIVARGGRGKQAFTMLIPRGWLEDQSSGSALWFGTLDTAVQGKFAAGHAGVIPVSVPVTPDAVVQILKADKVGEVEHEGPWAVQQVRSAGLGGLVWVRANPNGGSYVLQTFVTGAPLAQVRPQFAAMANSFRTAGQPPARLAVEESEPSESAQQKASDHFDGVVFLFYVVITLILIGLVAVFGRRMSARMTGAMLFFGVFSVSFLLYFGDNVTRYLFGGHATMPYVGHAGLLFGVGLLALLALLIPFRDPVTRRTLRDRPDRAQATVWTLTGMASLYEHALTASRIAIWAAVIVLVAIAWDVVMSGESMTNHGTRRLPRATRVLAFLGYVILVAATVLFYSGQTITGTGAAAESPFEPESVTNNGLFRVAFPLAVLIFLLRFGRDRRAAQAQPAQVRTNRARSRSGAERAATATTTCRPPSR